MTIHRFHALVLLVLCSAALHAQMTYDSLARNKQVSDSIIHSLRWHGNTSTPYVKAATIDTPKTISNISDSLKAKTAGQMMDSVARPKPMVVPAQAVDSVLGKNKWAGSAPPSQHAPGAVKQNIPTAGAAAAGPPAGMGGGFGKMAIGHVYGKIIDGQNKKPVSYCSVSIFTMGKDSLITGQLTEDNGDFSLTDLPFGAYNLKVTFLGYKTLVSKVVITPQKSDQDVGNLVLSTDATTLKEVDITAEKSTIELKVDRKVFNVGKDISARGGTGLDVMKNIPSVSVDASGNVTLRNNSPQIYIDGRPTTLTLEQIPADQIDRVEVITNPSAKFEAAASGGILNVILKRNSKPGYNGLVNAGIGTNDQYSAMVLLNLKQKKFGVSLSYNINGATNRSKGFTNRTNLDSITRAPLTYSHQDLNSTFTRRFQMARLGFDWFVNNRNTLSISENGVFGNFDNEDNYHSTFDSAGTRLANGTQDNISNNHFFNLTTDVNFKHTYPKEGKEYVLDVQYSYANGGGDYLYNINSYDSAGSLFANNPRLQSSLGGTHSHLITAQWDLALPLKKNMKVELGLRSNYKLTYSYQNIQDFDYGSEAYVPNLILSTNYRIDDLVNAAYGTFAQQIKGFSYQLGLRVEQVYYRGALIGKDSAFAYQYPTDWGSVPKMLFPSLNFSQKWKDRHELQVNFSRKSNRPNFFQIAPFIFSSDQFNVRKGNPSLQPEFINQAEINYNLTHTKFSWLSSVYGRYVQQSITSFIYPISPGSDIFLNTFQNADHSISGGWENTIKIFAVKKLDITLNGNIFYTSIQGGSEENNVTRSGFSWLGKAIISYKFPLDFTLQANGTYEAPKIQPQGNTTPLYYFDLSLAKDLGFVTFNFTVSDVLNSRTNGSHYITDTFIQDQSRRRDVRYAKLGVSFRFGKMDASFFKSKKKPQQGGGG